MSEENLPARAKTVREVIDLLDKTGWCQHALAKDKDGDKVNVLSEEACSYCLTGAVMHTCWVDEETFNEAWDCPDYQYIGDSEVDPVATCYQVLFDIEDTVSTTYFKVGRTQLADFNDLYGVDYTKVREVLVSTAQRLEGMAKLAAEAQ